MNASKEAKLRDSHTCQKCGFHGSGDRVDAHHVHPQWAGGADEVHNLITLCKQCHHFAPEFENRERAWGATADYVATGAHPVFDLMYFGAEYGLYELDPAEDEHFDAMDAISTLAATMTDWREQEGANPPTPAKDVYRIVFVMWKETRLARGHDDEPWTNREREMYGQ